MGLHYCRSCGRFVWADVQKDIENGAIRNYMTWWVVHIYLFIYFLKQKLTFIFRNLIGQSGHRNEYFITPHNLIETLITPPEKRFDALQYQHNHQGYWRQYLYMWSEVQFNIQQNSRHRWWFEDSTANRQDQESFDQDCIHAKSYVFLFQNNNNKTN